MDADGRGRRTSELLHALAVLVDEGDQPRGGLRCREPTSITPSRKNRSHSSHSPSFARAGDGRSRRRGVLEVEAQIEQRLREHLLGAQQQRDQQAADASVAVEERMDRLELDVRQRRLHEDRCRLGSSCRNLSRSLIAATTSVRGRGHEAGVARPCAAEPVLAVAGTRPAPCRRRVPRASAARAPRGAVVAQRELAGLDPLHAVVHRRDVVRRLLDVVERDARGRSFSKSSRSESDDCVPSICEESTASLRTYE